jgi:hypothetical protein
MSIDYYRNHALVYYNFTTPDKKLNDAIVFLHQNKGLFPNRPKKQFPEITGEEIETMEKIYNEIFVEDQ